MQSQPQLVQHSPSPAQRPELVPIQSPVQKHNIYRGPPGKDGKDGAPGPPGPIAEIDYEKLAAATAPYVVEQMAVDERFRGPPGKDGVDGQDADLTDILIRLQAVEDALANQQHPTDEWSHLVLVALTDAEYWPRLKSEYDRARDYYSEIRHVEPPSYDVRGPMPMLVAYEGGKPDRTWSGSREVSEALSAISRGEFDSFLSRGE